MNRIVLLGRLTKDPEMKVIEENGKVVTRFILAVDRTRKNAKGERETDFIPVVLWGRKAEVTSEYMSKGSMVTVSGSLQTNNYVDKDGIKRYTFEVLASEIQFVDSRKVEETAV